MIKYEKKIKLSDINGYQRFYDKNHPLSYKDGLVYYHRHVASLKIGRWLKTNEEVHHIDGNRSNNDPENLEILVKSEHAKRHGNKKKIKCRLCNKDIEVSKSKLGKTKYCSKQCFNKHKRKFEITKQELLKLVKSKPFTAIGRMFKVSDNAIRKRCRKLDIKI